METMDPHVKGENDSDEDWVPPNEETDATADARSTVAEEIAKSFRTPQVEDQHRILSQKDDDIYGNDDDDVEEEDAYNYEYECDVDDQDYLVVPPVIGAKASGSSSTAPPTKNRLRSEWDKWKGKLNLDGVEKKAETRSKHTGRDDRATVENVLDPRTRMILFRILSQGYLQEIHGCISTGKEANVYHGWYGEGKEAAVKIYKTSILSFKDRDRYVSGEYRFRNGYSKHNPRKMVKLWAEKEMRNLKRIYNEGIPCPNPILLRSHVLLMDFVGKDGVAAPLLKDAKLNSRKLSDAYDQLVRCMRRLYKNCHLVHADLSEYNVLWMDGRIYLIDVSQSVEMDHPRALEFLKMDCRNVTNFFRKRELFVMSPKELFEYVVNPHNFTEEQENQYLSRVMDLATERGMHYEYPNEESSEDSVFMQSFVPQSLHQIDNFEEEYKNIQEGNLEGIYHQALGVLPNSTGTNADHTETQRKVLGSAETSEEALLVADNTRQQCEAVVKGHTSTGDFSDQDNDQSSNEGGGDSSNDTSSQFLVKEATKSERKAHKEFVKAQKREQRKNKIKKHIKKRYEKSNKK